MSVYDVQVHTVDGSPVELSAYQGKVLLIVNTASRCSYSRQFAGLQELYEQYHDKGLEILGFPCNQFNGKEPDPGLAVQEYCKNQFGVTFPLFEKVDVRGPSAHALFSYLTEQAPFQGFDRSENGQWMRNFLQEKYPDIYAGDGIKWNFTKFVIDRSGRVCGRFETNVEPGEIEPLLATLL